MKITCLFIILSGSILVSNAQKFITEKSEISFFSEALLENIEAVNTKSVSIINSENGEIVFSIPMKEFQFKKSLMQEHFNEKYIESHKYPKSTFHGKILDFDMKEGKRAASAEGDMKIHGVTKKVNLDGELEIKDGKIFITLSFQIKIEDYKIKIPKLLFQNIAEIVDVKIDLEYKKYEK